MLKTSAPAPRRRGLHPLRQLHQPGLMGAPSANSASRLARLMSRHISGWLPAMRVKSLKPVAAKSKQRAASVLLPPSRHRQTPAELRQMTLAEHRIVLVGAHAERPRRRWPATTGPPPPAALGQGGLQRGEHHRRCSNSHTAPPPIPAVRPAIRVRRHYNKPMLRQVRAHQLRHIALGAATASVTIAALASNTGAMASNTAHLPHRRGHHRKSAPATAWAGSWLAASITPARWRG